MEDGLKHYAAHHAEEPVPRPLLRELLGEAMAVGQLAARVNLLGSRLAAARTGGRLVIASACGAIGEELSVVILADAGSARGEFQVCGSPSCACRASLRCMHAADTPYCRCSWAACTKLGSNPVVLLLVWRSHQQQGSQYSLTVGFWVQCVGRMRAPCAGMPIQQLCFSDPAGPGQGPLLLAARAHSWLCFHEVAPAQQAGARHATRHETLAELLPPPV